MEGETNAYIVKRVCLDGVTFLGVVGEHWQRVKRTRVCLDVVASSGKGGLWG